MEPSGLSTKTPQYCTFHFIGMRAGTSIPMVRSGAWYPADKAPGLDSTLLSVPLGLRIDHDDSSVNIPWPEKGMKDADYLLAFQKIVMPIALEFAPDMVISEQHCTVPSSPN